jgi:hypothetical protein
MAAVNKSSNADDEGKPVGCSGEEDNEDFGLWMVNQTHLHLLCQHLTL